MPSSRIPSAAAAEKIETVYRAITDLGAATADAIAAQAGMAYSTVTPKLRALADDGRAEFFRDTDGKGKWRTTTASASSGTEATDAGSVSGQTDTAEPEAAPEATDLPLTHPAVDTTGPAGTGDTIDDLDMSAGDETQHPPAGPDEPAVADDPASTDATQQDAARTRRRNGTIGRELLAIMQAEPDTAFKVGVLAKQINASAGAVASALNTLAAHGSVRLVTERPAAYQAS
jgi:hypothetical protein